MWSALGNEPLNHTARWVAEPNTRGTYSILSSCIITLVLCIWSALHLNVPDYKYVNRRLFWKAVWLYAGLLAPEIVSLAAYYQYEVQRGLTEKMQRQLHDMDKSKPTGPWYRRWPRKVLELLHICNKQKIEMKDPYRRNPWTTTHSFFAVMGGFVFDNGYQPEQCPLPDNRQRVTLTKDGLLLLAKLAPELLPDISLSDIRDKSKGDGLTNAIACVQALWFCLQTITRLAQHLPVTLLELNTFAHALCALVVYLVWWDKPLNVTEPFIITVAQPRGYPPNERIQRTAAFCAIMCIVSSIDKEFPCLVDGRPYHQKGMFRAVGKIAFDSDVYKDIMGSGNPPSEASVASEAEAEPSEAHDAHAHEFPVVSEASEVSQAQALDAEAHEASPRPNSTDGVAESATKNGDNAADAIDNVAEKTEEPDASLDAKIGDAIIQIINDEAVGVGASASAAASAGASAGDNVENVRETGTLSYKGKYQFIFFQKVRFRTPWASVLDGMLDVVVQASRSIKDRIKLDVDPGYWKRTELAAPLPKGKLTQDEVDTVLRSSYDLVGTRAFNWSFEADGTMLVSYTAAFAVVSLFYGAWHLTAWTGPFHGRTEMLLWRGSGIGVGAAGVVIAFYVYFSVLLLGDLQWLMKYLQTAAKMSLIEKIRLLVLWFFMGPVPLLMLFMMACRLCLVVESVVGLLYVPDGVFELPNWSLYFPHIG